MIAAHKFKKIYGNPTEYSEFQKTPLGRGTSLSMHLDRMNSHQNNEDKILTKYKNYKGNSNYIGHPEFLDIHNPYLDDDDRNHIKTLMINQLNDEDFQIDEQTKTILITPLVNEEELLPVTLEDNLDRVTVNKDGRVVEKNENMYLYGEYVGTLGDLKDKFSLTKRGQLASGLTPNNVIYSVGHLNKLGTVDELKGLFRIKKVNGVDNLSNSVHQDFKKDNFLPVTLEHGLNRVTVDENKRVVKENEDMYLYGEYVGTLGDLKINSRSEHIYDLQKKLGTVDELEHSFSIKKVIGGKLKSRYNRKSKKLRKNGRKSNRRR